MIHNLHSLLLWLSKGNCLLQNILSCRGDQARSFILKKTKNNRECNLNFIQYEYALKMHPSNSKPETIIEFKIDNGNVSKFHKYFTDKNKIQKNIVSDSKELSDELGNLVEYPKIGRKWNYKKATI